MKNIVILKDRVAMSNKIIWCKLMKRIYIFSLIFFVFILSTNKDIVAGTWTEDFNRNLDSWTKREHQRERVTWQIKTRRLYVETEVFCIGRLNLDLELALATHYTLAFTSFPIDTDQLQVELSVILSENAYVAIFIGKQPEDEFVNVLRRTYQFTDQFIGGPVDFPDKSPNIEDELELKKIKVAFDSGRFELFANDKEIVFQDDNFLTINYLGIVVVPKMCTVESKMIVDDFIISGPSINLDVQPKSKAAVLWGTLKHR